MLDTLPCSLCFHCFLQNSAIAKESTVFGIAELFHQIHRAVTVLLVYKNSTKKIKRKEILSCLTISVP
jgi:hypothetical protein